MINTFGNNNKITVISIIGIALGLLVMASFIPLPKFKLLFSLVALGLLVIGIDFIAVTPPDAKEGAGPAITSLIGGLLAGLGCGYFAKWLATAMRHTRK